jgi:hypothetical protein
MQSAFGTVLWIVCGLGFVAAFFSLVGSGKTWEEYGKNRLVMDSERATRARPGGPVASQSSTAERDDEIRQLLEARNARRARRGEHPVDIETELARLVAPAVDDALRSEIRELVVARNFRRMRSGKPPLDVEDEIARELSFASRPIAIPSRGDGRSTPL